MSDPFVVLCDLDGVVWLARDPIEGSPEAIEQLRAAGHRVVFVTNNSFTTVEEQESHLASIGVPAKGDVVTSAMAAATLIEPGMSVFVCGGLGISQAVRSRGAFPIELSEAVEAPDAVDAVVVGLHRGFDYEVLQVSSTAIRLGARFIASNEDPTYPTPEGPVPGGGSMVAAVAAASGRRPEVAGKPHAPMAELLRSTVIGLDSSTVMIGDRPSTDGRFAQLLGCRFALVRSDTSWEDSPSHGSLADVRVDFEGGSLTEISRLLV